MQFQRHLLMLNLKCTAKMIDDPIVISDSDSEPESRCLDGNAKPKHPPLDSSPLYSASPEYGTSDEEFQRTLLQVNR